MTPDQTTPARKKGRVSKDESVRRYRAAIEHVTSLLAPGHSVHLSPTFFSKKFGIAAGFIQALVSLGAVEKISNRHWYWAGDEISTVTPEAVKAAVLDLSRAGWKPITEGEVEKLSPSAPTTTKTPPDAVAEDTNDEEGEPEDEALPIPHASAEGDAPKEQYVYARLSNGVFDVRQQYDVFDSLEAARTHASVCQNTSDQSVILKVVEVYTPTITLTTTTRL